MANLNLSQFTEKTLVADADWVFVWDTAGAISKKVSRNSLLNSGTLTTSAPVTISQTWDASAVAFTAFKVNATNTNSASGSLLLDLQVGGVSKFFVTKNGSTRVLDLSFDDYTSLATGTSLPLIIGTYHGVKIQRNSTSAQAALLITTPSTGTGDLFRCSTLDGGAVVNGNPFTISYDGSLKIGGTDTILLRDASNTLALRNGTNAQTFNVYGTYTSGSVYERMFARYDGTALAFQVGTQHVGASARPLQLLTDNAARMTIGTTGNVGIGTTAPAEKLHVLGGKVLVGDPTDTTGAAVTGDLTVAAWRAPQLNLNCNTNSSSFFGVNLKAASTLLGGILVNSQSGEVKLGAFSGSGYFPTFYSNNVEAMRISTAGNVGIGTTAPSSKLQVTGGDVEVSTIASGLILKSPDGTRYRVTVPNGGTVLTITPV